MTEEFEPKAINHHEFKTNDGTRLSGVLPEEGAVIYFDPINPSNNVFVKQQTPEGMIKRAPTAEEMLHLLGLTLELDPEYYYIHHLRDITTLVVNTEIEQRKEIGDFKFANGLEIMLSMLTEDIADY